MTNEVVSAAARLADVLARENAALTAMDLSSAVAMLTEKQEAAALFARCAKELGAAPPPDLAALVLRLSATATDNRRLLERAIAVQGRVNAAVARAISRALASTAPRYAPPDGPGTPARPAALALSFRA